MQQGDAGLGVQLKLRDTGNGTFKYVSIKGPLSFILRIINTLRTPDGLQTDLTCDASYVYIFVSFNPVMSSLLLYIVIAFNRLFISI